MLYSLAGKEKILSTATLKLSKTNYKTQELISYFKIQNKDKIPLTEKKDSITGIKIIDR
ncbi:MULTISPECIES: hypothetical protein [unclassified Paraflavitalea]|uniref:hypothetical protein n=1 Tax=unclassified Paraflavitalea TaxID=2798305 RepID=UPI003D353A26